MSPGDRNKNARLIAHLRGLASDCDGQMKTIQFFIHHERVSLSLRRIRPDNLDVQAGEAIYQRIELFDFAATRLSVVQEALTEAIDALANAATGGKG